MKFILRAELHLLRFLTQTVRLGPRTRAWLSHQDPLHQRWTDNMIRAMRAPCDHPANMLAKSGNRHGSFQKCCQCNTRWKWVVGAWEELPSLPLPRPSPPSDSYGARTLWAGKLLPGLDVEVDTTTCSGRRSVSGLKPKPKPSPRRRGELDFTESELRSMRLEVGAPPINRPMVLQSGDLEFLEEHYQESLRTREQRRLEQASGSREQQAWEDPGEEEEIQVEHDGEYAWDLVPDS